MAKPSYQRPRGTYDIVPPEYELWRVMIDAFESVARDAAYERISTPAFEDRQLFNRSVGADTELISKEMYNFEDKSGNQLSLRPEGTAPIVRAYLENGLNTRPKPVKLYMIDAMWRYERPQKGRFRQFMQAGVEVFGSAEPLIDAQVIALAARYYRQLGLEFSLQINSLGSESSRQKFVAKLRDHIAPHKSKLPELVTQQLQHNPLRILDSKDERVRSLIANGPQIIDFLDRTSARQFEAVLEQLDNFGIEYDLNPTLVRGFDYYSGTLFEFWGTHQGAQNAIGGGGRYDRLIEELGGRNTPAVGFGVGMERVLVELQKRGISAAAVHRQVYIVSLGDDAKEQAFILEQQLLDAGVAAVCELTRKNLADQLARANKLGADYALIIGKKELIDKTVIVKDMRSGNQEVLPQAKATAELARRTGAS